MRKTVQTDYFLGESESMTQSKPITPQQMRDLEAAAMASGRVTGLELMERAGQGVVDAIFEMWPDLADLPSLPQRAVVLCGPGNNGGDGFVVARLLSALGWRVEVFLYGDPDKLPKDARTNYDRWCRERRVEVLTFPNLTKSDGERLSAACYEVSGTRLVIDALFGIGLSRSVAGLQPFLELNDLYVCVAPDLMPARHVAIDVPTGLAETGPLEDGHATVFCADLTVTFHTPKTTHLAGSAYCGKLVVKDIGL